MDFDGPKVLKGNEKANIDIFDMILNQQGHFVHDNQNRKENPATMLFPCSS